MIVLDHPAIRDAERTGYPGYSHPLRTAVQRICPWCGEDIGDKSYSIENDQICVECFDEWVRDYLHTNPDEVAAALSVPVTYEA